MRDYGDFEVAHSELHTPTGHDHSNRANQVDTSSTSENRRAPASTFSTFSRNELTTQQRADTPTAITDRSESETYAQDESDDYYHSGGDYDYLPPTAFNNYDPSPGSQESWRRTGGQQPGRSIGSESESTQTSYQGDPAGIEVSSLGQSGSSDQSSSSSVDGFTNVSSPGSGGNVSSSPTTPPPLVCQHDQASGLYSTAISINLSCTESADIYYCVSSSGACCNAETDGSLYTGSFDVGLTDGEYCVSYFGDGAQSNSNENNVLYTIDTSLPNLNVNFEKISIQSTHASLNGVITSSDFGSEHYYLHQVNTKSFDPIDAMWSCEDILLDHENLTSPASFSTITDYAVEVLSPIDEILQSIGLHSLDYGENFITSIMEDRQRNMYSCHTVEIELADISMPAIIPLGTKSALTSAHRSYGGFASFSYFHNGNPASTQSGQGSSEDSNVLMQSNFLSITY